MINPHVPHALTLWGLILRWVAIGGLAALFLTCAACSEPSDTPAPDATPAQIDAQPASPDARSAECTAPNTCPHGQICVGEGCAKLCDAEPCPTGLTCTDLLVGGNLYPVCQ